LIGLAVAVAVNLDDQAVFIAEEIPNEAENGMLAAKFDAVELLAAQSLPQDLPFLALFFQVRSPKFQSLEHRPNAIHQHIHWQLAWVRYFHFYRLIVIVKVIYGPT
jgi:hypothetical protein